jgi:hypothetical protein
MTNFSDLPEADRKAALAAFAALGRAQRWGDPERLGGSCLDNRGIQASGIYSLLTEHVGDLTHRMTERFESLGGQRATCADKIERGLRWLRAHEVEGQVRRNHAFASSPDRDAEHALDPSRRPRDVRSLEEWTSWWRDAGRRYAEVHAGLTVFNHAQWHAREAAVELGFARWPEAIGHLEALSARVATPDGWREWCGEVVVGSDGMPVPFRGPGTGRAFGTEAPVAMARARMEGVG